MVTKSKQLMLVVKNEKKIKRINEQNNGGKIEGTVKKK